MRMCQPHWDLLHAEVIEQGMGEWIPNDPQTVLDQLADHLRRGEDTVVNYDPLMACHMMIMSRALDMVGPSVLSADFGCPICYLNGKRNPDGSCSCGTTECGASEPGSIPAFESWLVGEESCVPAARAHMVEKGWLT